jgi:DivIVA domain-containing protein
VAADEPKTVETRPEPSAEGSDEEMTSFALRDQVPAEIRNVSFPHAMRGYDRAAVEAYVKRVNRVIAELEVSRSPQAAVKHALDRVGEQTIAILREARESAEKIAEAAREEAEQNLAEAKAQAANLVVNASTEAEREKTAAEQELASARAEASEILSQARAEAEKIISNAHTEAEQRRKRSEEEIAALQAQAEARMHDLQSDTDAVWSERDALLDELGSLATRLQEVAGAAAARSSAQKDAAPEGEPEPAAEKPTAS